MKKLSLHIVALILVLSLLLSSCGQTPSASCGHTDSNGDYICDACQVELQKPECTTHIDTDGDQSCDDCTEWQPAPECSTHADGNGDLLCDVCNKALSKPACATHMDKNGDLSCDTCGEKLPKPQCTTHTDANGDFACDACGEKLPKPQCTTHTDANGDFVCDVCTQKLPKPPCTTHTDKNGDLSCDLCEAFVDEVVKGWLLDGVPTYKGGTLSKKIYIAGQGIDTNQLAKNENKMQAVSKTTAAQFSAYLLKLEKAGYEKEFYRESDANLFASYIDGDVRVYAYFMSRTGEARIVKENAKISSSLSSFEYTYKKKQGEQSVLYQFALAMTDATHPKPTYKNNGMFYIIKLADSSVLIIDGGNSNQFPDSRCDELMNMLWDITGKQKGETVKIAGWFITHSHVDHHRGFVVFTQKYSKYLDLERIFFALPSLNTTEEILQSGSGPGGYQRIIDTVDNYFADDDPDFLRLHTGQTFSLADVSFEVLQTHEDLVNPATGATMVTNYNDVSTVIRVTIDGETFLILGDIGDSAAMPKILNNWSSQYLRSDAVQLAHHGMNNVTPLYKVVQASVLMVPQSRYGIDVYEGAPQVFEVAKSYARKDMIFFTNELTVGIAVVNEQWEKVYSVPFTY